MTTRPETLREALSDPAVWPDRPDRVECIETHISWVFLTREFAWKIKKPVEFGFLDFSTLQRRKHFCEEELRLNRRTAPDLYVGVVPICGTLTSPKIDGTGEPIEYAVKMKRFDKSGLLSQVAIEKRLTPSLIDALAEEIADFHNTVPSVEQQSGFGQPDTIQQDALENFAAIKALADGEDRRESALRHLKRWTIAEGHRLSETLARRREDGFVRECHGDLHLGNIVEIDGRPRLFDCIEFNAGFRWSDVISELAFLVMDLEEHDEESLARRLLNRYLERTGDYAGLELLRYYLVYRAMVRAKVDMIRLRDASVSVTQKGVLWQEFGNYLSIADHNSEPTPPALVIMRGLSGSGKTWLSQQIIELSPAIRIRSDIERKRLQGIGEAEHVIGPAAVHLYSQQTTRQTYAHLASLARTIIQAGFPVVVDATFLDAEERRRFRELAGELDVPFCIVACTAQETKLLERVLSRAANAHDASDAGVDVLREQMQSDEGFDANPVNEVIRVDTSDESSVTEALARLMKFLAPTQKPVCG